MDFKIEEFKPVPLPQFDPFFVQTKPIVASVTTHVTASKPGPIITKPASDPVPIEKNKFYNKSLIENLKLLDDEKQIASQELEEIRATIDRKIFYELLLDWDYGGIQQYDTQTSQRSLLALQGLQSKYGMATADAGGALFYTVGKLAYYVQFKPVPYSLFEKDPM
jgi:uncharacterized protein YcgL (UPF0745 family)